MTTLPQSTLAILADFFQKLSLNKDYFLLPEEKVEIKTKFHAALSSFITQHVVNSIMSLLKTNIHLLKFDILSLSSDMLAISFSILTKYSNRYIKCCKGSYLMRMDPFIVETWDNILSFQIIKKVPCLVDLLNFLFLRLCKVVVPLAIEKSRVVSNVDLLKSELLQITTDKLSPFLKKGSFACCSECNTIYTLKDPTVKITFPPRNKTDFNFDLGEFMIPFIGEGILYHWKVVEELKISKRDITHIDSFVMDKINYFWHSYGKKDNNFVVEIIDKIFTHRIITGPVPLFDFFKDFFCHYTREILISLGDKAILTRVQLYDLVEDTYGSAIKCFNFFKYAGTDLSEQYSGKDLLKKGDPSTVIRNVKIFL